MPFLLVAEVPANTSCNLPLTSSHTRQLLWSKLQDITMAFRGFAFGGGVLITLYNNCRFMCFYLPSSRFTTIDRHTSSWNHELGSIWVDLIWVLGFIARSPYLLLLLRTYCRVVHRSQPFLDFRIYTFNVLMKALAGHEMTLHYGASIRASGDIRSLLQICCQVHGGTKQLLRALRFCGRKGKRDVIGFFEIWRHFL